MSKHTIINSELLGALPALPDNTFDGILCDPPYELGFMGKSWDASGVTFSPATWAELLRVCKPGAALLAFGGTRTYHRLACAIEDGGWGLRDCLMWVYGSGFPKSRNLGGGWNGYGTALKPAYEPCVLARKTLEGTVAANVQKWGCGALWIDGGRIGAGEDAPGGGPSYGKCQGVHEGWKRPSHEAYENKPGHNFGRWPANIIHDGSPEVLAGFPETKSGVPGTRRKPHKTGSMIGTLNLTGEQETGYGDSGSAARFFYTAKASQRERNAGLEGRNGHPCCKPLDLCRYLATLILPPAGRPQGPRKLLVPFSGSGSEIIGGLFAGWDYVQGIEREAEYVEIAKHRLAHWANAPQEYFPETLHELDQEHKPWAHLPLLESPHA